MEIWLATKPKGKSQHHKYDGQDTFCKGFGNDGLGYTPEIYKASLTKYNYLKASNKICALCQRKEYINKIMAGPGASPKEGCNRNPTITFATQAQSDIKQSRIDKAEFDTLSGG